MSKSKKKKNKSNSKAQNNAEKKNSGIDTGCVAAPEIEEEKKDLLVQENDEIETAVENEAEDTAKADNPEVEKESAEPSLPAAPMVEIPYDPDFSTDDFSDSVKKLKPKDIVMPQETEKKAKRKKKASLVTNIIQIFLLVVCASVAVVCLYMLGENIWGKIKGQEIYSKTEFDVFTLDDLGDTSAGTLAYITKDVPMLTVFERIESGKSAQIEPVQGQYNEQLAQMKASLSALKEQNKDVYGWIYIEGTNINHPIVRGQDNSYYLNHAYTGEYLPIGSIFADLTTADLITDNFNTVLYGHNVVSTGQSSMFHDVEKFLDWEFFSNTKIYIYTMDGAFVFQPIAVYDTVSDYFYFKAVFRNEEEFLTFATEMVQNSRFNMGTTFVPGDRMLTLSTCTNGAQNGRYALQAKLVEVIK